MSAESSIARVLELQAAESLEYAAPMRAQLIAVEADGKLRVRVASGRELLCEWLETSDNQAIALSSGDSLLVLAGAGAGSAVVLGRIGSYRVAEPAAPPHVTIEATESLTLKCGEATVDLRKDGKLMIRGEDVLLRAKGTQRIKAGTVSIN